MRRFAYDVAFQKSAASPRLLLSFVAAVSFDVAALINFEPSKDVIFYRFWKGGQIDSEVFRLETSAYECMPQLGQYNNIPAKQTLWCSQSTPLQQYDAVRIVLKVTTSYEGRAL